MRVVTGHLLLLHGKVLYEPVSFHSVENDFIIKKVSDGKFNTLEDWKKAYFKEVVDKLKQDLTLLQLTVLHTVVTKT